ncbi:Protein CBG07622 [Caenorhabditis briggsae]|uniref:Uncharacterized protein n=2 Tax=Caenorhabditis briggsae TaxID=6238 RepID=A0AAE8ZU29_CAEBR|nr:Protein CBG07622 [Caenorhabditis briggsae]ULT84569.1 hypothetical protein L3Y34_013314 [Caenorhabditis briggsae]CAP27512.1 Protein CBG07622 [Caenorhabditis briggsae]
MSLTTSRSAQFDPLPNSNRNRGVPNNSSTHSLATLNNNHTSHHPLPPPSLEPLRETTPLTNGGGKYKKVTVPVPDPTRRLRQSIPPTYSSFPFTTLAYDTFEWCWGTREASRRDNSCSKCLI